MFNFLDFAFGKVIENGMTWGESGMTWQGEVSVEERCEKA